MADQPAARQTKRKRSIWPYALCAMFCVHASIVFITMTFASKTPANAEPGYYESAVAWDEGIEARLTAEREGWSIETAAEGRSVTLSLRDHAGEPIAGAAVSAVAFHRADALDRTTLTFTESAPGGYTAQLPTDRVGLWDLRFTITAGDAAAEITRTVEQAK